MALHSKEFDGSCPVCGGGVDYLDKIKNYEDEWEIKYKCDECKIIIRVNDETDEYETEDMYE